METYENDEEQRARKGKAKIVYEEEEPELYQKEEEAESDERFLQKKSKSKRIYPKRYPLYPYENLNGASTSSSSSSFCDFNKNRITLRFADYSEMTTPQNPQMNPSSSRNPNSQSSPCRSRTKAEVARFRGGVKRRRTGGFQFNGAEDARLIFEKTLLALDLHLLWISFDRLIRNDFLTPVESRIIYGQGSNFFDTYDDGKPGIGAILVNGRSQKFGVIFKICKINNIDTYVLTCGWNDFVEANGLQEGDNISLWSFRCRQVLCFHILVTHPPPTMAHRSSSLRILT